MLNRCVQHWPARAGRLAVQPRPSDGFLSRSGALSEKGPMLHWFGPSPWLACLPTLFYLLPLFILCLFLSNFFLLDQAPERVKDDIFKRLKCRLRKRFADSVLPDL